MRYVYDDSAFFGESPSENEIIAHCVVRLLRALEWPIEKNAVKWRKVGVWYRYESVNHSVGQWVNDMVHANGVESFWAMFKRTFHGTYHHMSKKYLNRYVEQFAGKHNLRELDTIDQMQVVIAGVIGKRLLYKDLIA